ncbi:unnamed protein product [Ectocarpus sp. 13 AM-2016]
MACPLLLLLLQIPPAPFPFSSISPVLNQRHVAPCLPRSVRSIQLRATGSLSPCRMDPEELPILDDSSFCARVCCCSCCCYNSDGRQAVGPMQLADVEPALSLSCWSGYVIQLPCLRPH